jgi:hypothetical protein
MKSCKYVHYEIDPADRHKLTELNKVLTVAPPLGTPSSVPSGLTMLTVPSPALLPVPMPADSTGPDPVARCTLHVA